MLTFPPRLYYAVAFALLLTASTGISQPTQAQADEADEAATTIISGTVVSLCRSLLSGLALLASALLWFPAFAQTPGYALSGDQIYIHRNAPAKVWTDLSSHRELRTIVLQGRVSSFGPLGVWSISAYEFAQIANCRHLKVLIIEGPIQIPASAFAALRELGDLRDLRIYGSGFSDAAAEHLSGVPFLESLRLHDNKLVGDATLRAIGRLTRLRHLSLHGTGVSDEGMQHIASLVELESLDMSETSIGDRSLEVVANLSMLRSLDIRHTDVTDAGIRALSDLRLHQLHVTN